MIYHFLSHRNNKDLLLGKKILLFGTLTLVAYLASACHQNPKKIPQSHLSPKVQPFSVEQQLLSTIKEAETLGQGNPLLLSSIYSLATYYHAKKEYDKSANQYQRALTIKELINGPNHPDIAAILKRYARVLQDAKRPAQAANLLARANAISAQMKPNPFPQ